MSRTDGRRPRAVALGVLAGVGLAAAGVSPAWAGNGPGAGTNTLFGDLSTGMAVSVSSGNLLATATKVPIAHTDPQFDLTLTYNSLNAGVAGRHGAGWTSNAGPDVKLAFPSANVVLLTDETGFVERFDKHPGGSYTSADAGYGSLIYDGSTGVYSLKRFVDGSAWTFDGGGFATSYADPYGQKMTFSYTSGNSQTVLANVTDPGATHSYLSYNGVPQVIEVDDPSSNHFYYSYNADKLTGSQGNTGSWAFVYDSAGRLSRITYPDGSAQEAAYDTQGRATAVTAYEPGHTTGLTTTFAYQAATAPCDPQTDAGETIVQPPSGDPTTYCYDANGNVTSQHGAVSDSDLFAIADQLTGQMSNPNSGIVEVGVDDELPQVDVGVLDLQSAESQAIIARYGSAVALEQGDEGEFLVGDEDDDGWPPAAPGADDKYDPLIGGVRIVENADDPLKCTSGFAFLGSMNPGNQDTTASGIITAGHCLENLHTTGTWKQGGDIIGPFSRRRGFSGDVADAGTITTRFAEGSFGYRDITNKVYRGPALDPLEITSKARHASGYLRKPVCMTGGASGYVCGKLVKVGKAKSDGKHYGFTRKVDGTVIYQNYDLLRDTGRCLHSDSGSPVYTSAGQAVGIIWAGYKQGKANRCTLSQISNVEWQLKVPVYLGDDD